MKSLSLLIFMLFMVSLHSQDTLRVREVFDFEIGDEFHFETTLIQLPGIQVQRKLVEDKWYSNQEDTLYYKFRINEYSDFLGAPEPTGKWYDEIRSYTNLDSFVWHETLGNNPCNSSDTCVVETTFSTYCESSSMKISLRTGLIDFEENTEVNEYALGLGKIQFSSYQDDGNTGISTQLVYHKRGTEDCGTPNDLTNVEESISDPSLEIFPNPVQQFLTINHQPMSSSYSITLTDIHGKLLFSQSGFNKSLTLNTNYWKSGIYIVQYVDGRRRVTSKIIKH